MTDSPFAPDAPRPADPAPRLTPPPGGSRPQLVVRAEARPENLACLRDALRHWLLRPLGAAHNSVEGLVLAATEACANAIEHAYPNDGHGMFELSAWHDPASATVHIRIRDWGVWDDAGDTGNGYGLTLMNAFAMTCDIHRHETGTEVLLSVTAAA